MKFKTGDIIGYPSVHDSFRRSKEYTEYLLITETTEHTITTLQLYATDAVERFLHTYYLGMFNCFDVLTNEKREN